MTGKAEVMDTIEIRNIPPEDFSESLELSAFAFQYELSPEEIERRSGEMRTDEAWGAYVNGRLAARMTILKLQTWIHGRSFEMGGIAGVATWPEYRRGGLVSGLLSQGLKAMREQGQTLSFLHPFQFAFYRKFGWETYTEYKRYEMPVGLLPRPAAQAGRVERVEPGKAVGLLDSVYEAYACRYNGTLIRSESWWRSRILERRKGTAAVYYAEDGAPAGYVLYQVKDRVCTVHELVCTSRAARLGLWRFLSDHDSMMDTLVLQAPSDDYLPFMLDNPRIKQEIIPYFMARIVDAAAFVEKFPFASGAESALRLELTDPVCEWNNGTFDLQVDESGTARIERVADAERHDLPTATCDIQTLTTMLMGYKRPLMLHDIGRLQASFTALEMLERLLTPRQTYLPDFF